MITLNRRIEGGDFGSAGSATRVLKDQLRLAGIPVDILRRAMIASYEAEMNVVIHARRGTLWARLDGERLDLEVIDEGPGIPDIELALREGWSTASEQARRMGFGAGMGLPNIRRNSDRFEIDSEVGRGTRVRSTIVLTDRCVGPALRDVPEEPAPAPAVRADRCRRCHACVAACPTAALRLYGGGPRLLAPRCVGCTECAAACPDRVFVIGAADLHPVQGDGSVLVVPRGFLASLAADPPAVLSALTALGFPEVRLTEEWEPPLARVMLERVSGEGRPLLSPVCPAIVTLVEARFPGLLPHVAPFVSPLAAAAAGFPLQRLVVVPACPAQREAVRRVSRAGRVAVIEPSDLAAAVQPLLGAGSPAAESPVPRSAATVEAEPASSPGPQAKAEVVADEPADGVLRVTGLRHAVRVLELAEAGRLSGVRLLEAFACDGGCIGSPYLGVDPFVAGHRLAMAAAAAPRAASPVTAAVSRRFPPSPRAGARLDPDMATAIRMLAAIDEAVRSLPGRDCGSCGAPTCAAFAEDLVLGRAGASDCPHRTRPLDGAVAARSVGADARPRGDRTDRPRGGRIS